MKSLDVIKIRITIIVLFAILTSLLFGLFYYLLHIYGIDSLNFKENINPFDFWYYSWLNQLTVGYAQFYPTSNIGKILSMTQIFLFWIIVLSLSIIIDEENIIRFFSNPKKQKYYLIKNFI